MLYLKNMKKWCTLNAGFCSCVRCNVCLDVLYKLFVCDVDAAQIAL